MGFEGLGFTRALRVRALKCFTGRAEGWVWGLGWMGPEFISETLQQRYRPKSDSSPQGPKVPQNSIGILTNMVIGDPWGGLCGQVLFVKKATPLSVHVSEKLPLSVRRPVAWISKKSS